mmetsp:Transcript_14135/g.59555  ORF Transcript_14135/g.59555 Transcript_14135/m.59555 type:complete len:469 (+) Transcript_14135:1197-2603(+)
MSSSTFSAAPSAVVTAVNTSATAEKQLVSCCWYSMNETSAPGFKEPLRTSMPPYHSTNTVTSMGVAVKQNVYVTTYRASRAFCRLNSFSFSEKSRDAKGSPAKALTVKIHDSVSSAVVVASANAFCVFLEMVLKYFPYILETSKVGGSDASVTSVKGQLSANMNPKTPSALTKFRAATLMFNDRAFETVEQSLFRRDDKSPVLCVSKNPPSCVSKLSKSFERTRALSRAICTVKMDPRAPANAPAASAASNRHALYFLKAAGSRSMATASTSSPVKCGTLAAATAYRTRNTNATDNKGASGAERSRSDASAERLDFLFFRVDESPSPSEESASRADSASSSGSSRAVEVSSSISPPILENEFFRSSAAASASSTSAHSAGAAVKATSHAAQNTACAAAESSRSGRCATPLAASATHVATVTKKRARKTRVRYASLVPSPYRAVTRTVARKSVRAIPSAATSARPVDTE